MPRTAVLAYSGGLDTSCAIAWLREDYGFEQVVAVLVDVGQDADFGPAIARGRAAGADDVVLLDRKEAFAEDQLAKALLANALYEGRYPLISALSRPVIAGAVAEVALELDAEAVVHGCTGKGNDQLRFELAFKARYPGVAVIAPLRDRVWTRDAEIAYARARGIPVEATAESPYSIDDNLFGRAIEAGSLEDPWAAPPEGAFLLTAPPAAAPPAVDVVIGFEAGLPVSLDGEELPLSDLVAQLNAQAGAYGVGRIDMIENRAVGIKSRELYEAPAALTVIATHQALEELVLTKAELVAKRELEPRWAKLVYDRTLVQSAPRGLRRLLRGHAGAGRGRGPGLAPARLGHRHRPPLGARPLCRAAGLLRRGRDLSARGDRRLHSPRRARDRAPGRAPPCGQSAGMTLWSGRVGTELAPEVWEFLAAEDAELLPYDVEATRVHARRLHAAGLLSGDELAESERRLEAIEYEPGEEDVHTLIERTLGEIGRKLHAGRSRNDQVAAALRLYVHDASVEAIGAIEALARVLLERADVEADTPMPGYTHLQRAQPITVGHHLLAWVEMLDRDRARFRFAARQAAPSPLGAGALAGSTLDLPPPPGETMANSLDAVADRDFALDYLYACAVLFVHLSRIGEEVCLWVTSEFGFARLPEAAATGSSMMPQKLNPDVAELARGKAGTALGRLAGLLAVVKGLPLAYNRDLQEDKAAVFPARRDARFALAALSVLVAGLEFDRERLAAACADPLLSATDAAEGLVQAGTPFRDAHERVAEAVRAGTFEPPSPAAACPAPGPAGVQAALAAARQRFA